MPRKLVKDHAAETDLIGVWVYSFETWGEARADRYLEALKDGIGKIAEDPRGGDSRDELRAGYWSKRLERQSCSTPSPMRRFASVGCCTRSWIWVATCSWIV